MNLIYKTAAGRNILVERYLNTPTPLKAAFWFTVCSFLQKAFSMITVPIFTRLMTTEQYGEFSVFLSVFNIIVIITTLGVTGIITTRGMSKYKEHACLFISNVQLITTISVCFFFFLFLLFNRGICRFFEINTVNMILMFPVMLVTPAFEMWMARKRFEYDYKSILFFTLLFLIFNTIFGIASVYFAAEKGNARIISYCIVQIILYGCLYYDNYRGFSLNKINREMIRYAFLFNLPLIPQGLANQVLARSDVFMIQKILSTSDAGIYSLGYSIALLISILTTSIGNTFVPWLYQKIDCGDLTQVKTVCNYLVIVVFMGVCAIMFVAPEIIMVFAPENYKTAEYIVPPAVAGIGLMIVYTLFVSVETYCEKTNLVMLGSVCVAMVNIILNAVFIPGFGAVAAAYTTFVSYLGYSVAHYLLAKYFCRSTVDIDKLYNIKVITLSIVFLSFCMITVVKLYPHIIVRYIIFALILFVSVFLYLKKRDMLK